MLPRLFRWLKSLLLKPADNDHSVELTRIAKSGIPTGVTLDSKSLTFKVTDVGAYFGNWDEFEREKDDRRMRAERVQALTVDVKDASASIKTPEDLVRYFRNVPEKTRRKVLFETKK